MPDAVLEALREMRPPFALYEADLHRLIGERLAESQLPYDHEAVIGKGCRIDYLVGGVGIEIKKGKPSPSILLRQLSRYAASERVSHLIVVTWRSVRVPKVIAGKPIDQLVLSQLWGVSLP